MNKRYFIVFYAGSNSGWRLFTTDGHYVNLFTVKGQIANYLNCSLNSFYITNIIELSENDYNDATSLCQIGNMKNLNIKQKFIVYWSANDNWRGWQEVESHASEVDIEQFKNMIVQSFPLVIKDKIQITKITQI